MLEQDSKEQELEEKRMLLEKMQEEADAMRKEAELVRFSNHCYHSVQDTLLTCVWPNPTINMASFTCR
jgi:hypothetical protein